jgi:two-component system response regulator DesR
MDVHRIHILIADEPDVRGALAELIDSEDDLDIVATAGDPDEAANLAASTSPDVALVDAFGQEMRMDIVAKGIDTQAELETLLGRGARLGQGFFLARPAPLERWTGRARGLPQPVIGSADGTS